MSTDYIKYFVNPMFRREEFAALLNEVGIEAGAAEDGVILNVAQLKSISAARLPHWVYQNKRYILSPWHTREATMRELRDAQSEAEGIFLVGVHATSAFGGWEFGTTTNCEMFYRCTFDDYVGEWEPLEDYSIADEEGTIIYHLRGGENVLASDILRI